MTDKSLYFLLITENAHPRHQELVELINNYPNSEIIDFYTQDLAQLTIIAKHRVLAKPAILALSQSDKVLARIVHIPEKDLLIKVLDQIYNGETK